MASYNESYVCPPDIPVHNTYLLNDSILSVYGYLRSLPRSSGNHDGTRYFGPHRDPQVFTP